MPKPQTTTSFYQVIGDKRYQLTMPQTRVSKLLDRVDKLIEKGQFDKATDAITPFITHETADRKPRATTEKSSEDRRQAIMDVLEQNRDMSDAEIIKRLREEFGMSYPNARYYVKKNPR